MQDNKLLKLSIDPPESGAQSSRRWWEAATEAVVAGDKEEDAVLVDGCKGKEKEEAEVEALEMPVELLTTENVVIGKVGELLVFINSR
ncbi:unnamed protein product [Phytophthora lilii]|uniref:Unnamed protein product n=1 Tax=Phytophthora lilii TaxID=2077276 RepID=A0A9W6XAZ5_9STRA|nr:unnamed protein product [Phytophthora lilii]